jgi:glycosyltransferase involved in cell wall biosynthesis
MSRLSALVCVRNDEKRLTACLASLRFADELVVVLDRSAEIARQHADRVVVGAFPPAGSPLTAGVAACNGDWILEIDAADHVGPALAEEIRDAVNGAIEADHFLLPIDRYAGQRRRPSNSTETRLYRRGVKCRAHAGGTLINPLLRRLSEILPDKLRHLWTSLTADQRQFASHGQAAE